MPGKLYLSSVFNAFQRNGMTPARLDAFERLMDGMPNPFQLAKEMRKYPVVAAEFLLQAARFGEKGDTLCRRALSQPDVLGSVEISHPYAEEDVNHNATKALFFMWLLRGYDRPTQQAILLNNGSAIRFFADEGHLHTVLDMLETFDADTLREILSSQYMMRGTLVRDVKSSNRVAALCKQLNLETV
jgi:hypothetical protein